MKKTGLALCLALFSAQTLAAGYAGVDYVFSKIEPDGTTRDVDVSALQFKFGTWLNPEGTFGGEFRAALGMDDDELGNNVEVEIDRYYGAYLRGQFPGNVPVRPYGIIGLTRVETSWKAGGDSDSEDYSDVSLGIGADMDVSRQVFVTLEYLRAIDRSGDEVSNLSIGVGGRF